MSRVLTTRVDEQLAADLSSVAEYDGKAVSEVLREAISQLVRSRRADPAFRAKVIEALERGVTLLQEIGEPEQAARFESVTSQLNRPAANAER